MTAPHSLDALIQSDQVPTLPEVAVEVLRVTQAENPSVKELVRVIRMDPAIAGRIVKFANSPLFGIRRTEATIEGAVVLLGNTMIRTLVLGFSLASGGVSCPELRPHFQQIWREIMFQAAAAETLAHRHEGIDPAVWFLAGLLQDAGRTVLLNVYQQEYVDRVIHGDTLDSLTEKETRAFGFSHADVSAALCSRWNLNSGLVRAVRQHHDEPKHSSGNAATAARGLYSAALCCQYMEQIHTQPDVSREAVDRELMDVHHCLPDEVVEVLADIDQQARAFAAVLKADVGVMTNREDLLHRAQQQLMKIALAEHVRSLNSESNGDDCSDEPEQPEQEDRGSWLDGDTGAFAERLLDRVVPDEIEDCLSDQKTLGMLSIELLEAGQPCCPLRLKTAADIVRRSVRPSDRMIRQGAAGLLVLLPELSLNMLARVARRIQEQTSCELARTGVAISIGGLMIVPAGKKPAPLKSVLAALERSLSRSRRAGCEQFQILQGRRAEEVPVEQMAEMDA